MANETVIPEGAEQHWLFLEQADATALAEEVDDIEGHATFVSAMDHALKNAREKSEKTYVVICIEPD